MTTRTFRSNSALRIQLLGQLSVRPDFAAFRHHFDLALAAANSAELLQLKRVGAEALRTLLDLSPTPDLDILIWFSRRFDEGFIADSQELRADVRRLERVLAKESERRLHGAFDSASNVIQTKRVVQMSWFGFAGFRASDAFEVRCSVFRSPQERTFTKALKLRFPGLHVLPNYPLDQVVDLGRLRDAVDAQALRYGALCRLDALLVTPVEGDPIAAFELDSVHHDQPRVAMNDQWKNRLLAAARIPLFRIRSENPTATSADEWYGILTDEVLDKVDCGERIRSRDIHTTLVPLVR